MKTTRLLFTFFTLVVSLETYACICPSTSIKETREYSIKNSELIFIGQVIETDTVSHTYKIKVVEIFKGKPGEILIGSSLQDSVHYSSCAFWPFPYWGDEFIFYANYVKGTDRIFVDQCSATRTTLNPQAHLSYFTGKYEKMQGILYREMTFDEKIKFLETYNKLKQIAFKDLIEELKLLRKLKEKN